MKPVYVDTSYFFAIISPRDVAHEAAARWSREATDPLLTTEFVLIEVANAFCSTGARGLFRTVLDEFQADPDNTVLPATTELFRAGANLFLRRPDKQWSLTDCISFVVMEERGLTEALTTDHHFEQAGFTALLK